MTPQERTFVRHFASTGDALYSAEKAGYAHPEAYGYEKAGQPAIIAATRRTQVARLNNDLLPMAVDTLNDIMGDKTSTKKERLAAVAQVLKHTLGSSVDAAQGKEPHEMSSDELQQRIADLRREAAERARPIIDAMPEPEPEPEPPPSSGVFG